jgi:hypothetical protein
MWKEALETTRRYVLFTVNAGREIIFLSSYIPFMIRKGGSKLMERDAKETVNAN